MRSVSLRSALLLTALTVFLAGCSRSPVSPDNARLAPGGAGTLGGIQTDDPPSPDQGRPGATAAIRLAVGESGVVKAGRFTLFIHKNTLNVPATFSLWVANPEAMQVDVEVMPPVANDFQVPSHLTADLNDRPELNMADQTMYYWSGGWDVPEDITVDGSARTVTADMKSLTRCMVGATQRLRNRQSN